RIPPWGLMGGQPGKLGAYWIKRKNGKKEKIESKTTLILNKGDTLIIETPGGGGYGNPKAHIP
ncbi:MAG: hydantoinase B/oxoprolinase family protein, partial [Deltaproteobacteria bacterium]|nr:hydantoinase B/oxoprolinase family protein [Deltaproteobacteria bacterium]